jgi:hypothetical protein
MPWFLHSRYNGYNSMHVSDEQLENGKQKQGEKDHEFEHAGQAPDTLKHDLSVTSLNLKHHISKLPL